MAKEKQSTKKTKEPARDPDMPEGFVPLGRSRVAGWFVREVGNSIQGTIKDSFTVKQTGKFKGDRRVYVIDITDGETKVMNAEGVPETISEGTVGVDETGYLKKLADLEKDREVFLKCKGKEDPDDDKSPWIFAVGVVPF